MAFRPLHKVAKRVGIDFEREVGAIQTPDEAFFAERALGNGHGIMGVIGSFTLLGALTGGLNAAMEPNDTQSRLEAVAVSTVLHMHYYGASFVAFAMAGEADELRRQVVVRAIELEEDL